MTNNMICHHHICSVQNERYTSTANKHIVTSCSLFPFLSLAPPSATMSLYTFQDPTPSPTPEPIAEEEEYYSSWSLFLVCILLVISLWTSYYLQIKRIRAIHETVVSIFAGMLVGFVVRLAPGHLIREMLVRNKDLYISSLYEAESDGRRSDILCSSIFFYRPSF